VRESKIEKHLRREIEKLGGWMEKHVCPGRRGVPDNIVMWPEADIADIPGVGRCTYGQYVEFIETKAPDGIYKVLQQRDHARRRAMGFTVHVIWTMDQAEEYLKSRGERYVAKYPHKIVSIGAPE
jgi:hypothetical protein